MYLRPSASLASGMPPSRAFLVRAGAHAQSLHQRSFRQLVIAHVQLDELRTSLRHATQVLWLWVAIDPLSKSIPVLALGPRTHHMAQFLIHTLREQLAPDCLPVFTSNGLIASFYALTAHFGQWLKGDSHRRTGSQWQGAAGLLYGHVYKRSRRRTLIHVRQVVRLGTEPAFTAALQNLGFSGRVNTACIERVNLTIRRGVAALARRTWATALQTPHVQAHLQWWQASYHFVRPHASLRVALVQAQEGEGTPLRSRYRQRTPAMAAGKTSRRWTAGEVLCYPLPPLPA
jgi:IS1 family transposase